MKQISLAVIIVMTLLMSNTWSEDSFDIKVYSAAESTKGIKIDGRLDDTSWKEAITVSGFTFFNKPVKVTPQTFIQVTYDSKYLYFGITCDEPAINKLHPVAQARDAKAVFSGEAIEIFVDPEHSHTTYYQFGINSAGSIYDSRGQDPTWSADVRAGAQKDKTTWSLEVAIPWADLAVTPSPGALLGINVCRDRQIDGKQWSNWSQTQGGFHDPIHFGHLILSPTPELIAAASGKLRKGNRTGPVHIYTDAGISRMTYKAMAVASIGKLQTTLQKLDHATQAETSEAAKRELGLLLEQYRKQMAPFVEAVKDGNIMDAVTWTRMDLEITKISVKLNDAIWAARLKAIVSEI